MKFNLDILFATVIGILIILTTIQFKQKQYLQTQIDELHLLFNQKFLQEMVTDQPNIRSLEYRPVNQTKLIKFEI